MKGTLHNKIVYHDLLAIAIAGIISLLFAETHYNFLNVLNKRQDQSLSVDVISNDIQIDQQYLSSNNCDFTSPAEMAEVLQFSSVVSEGQSTRFVVHIFSKPEGNHSDRDWYITPQYHSSLPPAVTPSIPIALRKLLI